MTCHSPASAVRLLAPLLVISASMVGPAPVGGGQLPVPVPGRNANLASGPAELDLTVTPPKIRGDFLLKQDNEGSCARGSRNPKNILCGGNDYGLVDAPGIDPDDVVRDAGAGVYWSGDGGDTWESTMLPGHVLDTGSTSLLRSYKAFADITTRSGAAGIAFMSGIAFKSTNNTSIAYLATFLELNNQENNSTPFTHLHTVKLDSVPERFLGDPTKATAFIDKPWSVVLPPQPGVMCTPIHVPRPDGTVVTQVIPDSPVLIGYTVFTNLEQDPNLMVTFEKIAKVTNCGRNVGSRRIVGIGHRQNGISLAVSPVPNSKRVVAVWRRFASQIEHVSFTDAILAVVSNDNGQSWSLPKVVALICPFQQSPTGFTARVNTFPTVAIDHKNRISVAWSDRLRDSGGTCRAEGQSRIVLSTSTNGGQSWAGPVVLDAGNGAGHQITPSLTYGGGTTLLIWKDLRETAAEYFDGFINEFPLLKAAAGDPVPPPAPIVPGPPYYHHTIELYSKMANVDGANLQWGPSVRVSQYKFGKSASDTGPDSVQKQWEIINLRLFARGTKVFDSDYADAAGPPMLPPDPAATPPRSRWTLDTGQSGDPSFYGVWTSNRDVRRVAAHTDASGNTPVPYTPPGLTGPIRPDSAPFFVGCTPGPNTDFTKTMDQNLYGARIGLGTFAFSPGNNKQVTPEVAQNLGSDFQRAYVVTVRNDSTVEKTYQLVIPLQFRNPPGGSVAFTQFPSFPVTAAEATRIVTVAAKSTASRTVFIVPDDVPATTLNPKTLVRVDVTELVGGVAGDENTSVYINSDPSAPEIEAPEIEAREIYTPEIEAAEITVHAAPEIEAPEIEAPEIEAPEIEAPEIEAKSFQTPEIEAPEIEAPEIEAPEIEAPEIEAAAITDITWPVENTGNTTAGYVIRPTVEGSLTGFDFQLVVSRIVRQSTAVDCQPTFTTMNKVAVNIRNANGLVDPNAIISPEDLENATIWIARGERVIVTLRVRGAVAFDPAAHPTVLTVTQQAIDTTLLQAGVTEPPTFRGLPTGVVGEFYSTPLVATFGTPPYTWTVAEGSTLPPGLALQNTEGGWRIVGTPTTAGTFSFTLRVQDSTFEPAPQVQFIRFSLTIVGPLNIVTTSVPGAFVGRPYSFTPQVTGGARPYSFSLGESPLPAGLTLNEFTGEISGTPTQDSDGPNNFELIVEDAAGSFDFQSLAITVMEIEAGDFIVADGAVDFQEPTGTLYRVTPDGAFYDTIATLPGHPNALAQEASGSILIADAVRDGIYRVTPDHVQTVYDGDQLSGPVGLAVTPAGQIIVGDNANDRVYRLAPDGSRITQIATLPSSPSELQSVSVAGHPSGNMYVANGDTSGVTLFSISAAEVVTQITITNPSQGPLPTAVGDLAVDTSGNLVIADFGFGEAPPRIFVLTIAGVIVNVITLSDATIGTNMTGIDVESSGAYVVAVNFGNAVRRVVIPFEGGPIITTVISGTQGLTFPNDVIIFRSNGGQ
jgi:Putative Ig domain